jgi:hypothetical protein
MGEFMIDDFFSGFNAQASNEVFISQHARLSGEIVIQICC